MTVSLGNRRGRTKAGYCRFSELNRRVQSALNLREYQAGDGFEVEYGQPKALQKIINLTGPPSIREKKSTRPESKGSFKTMGGILICHEGRK